ncbi:hypothetical protein A5712_18520 [Mycobacterium sp. E2327]|uniref:hypothetical protein n=1 Tax=Mycobacterium sp. E2327 TaxID=1834132 RepID=UPI0007FBB2C2|nr:hypothetical protein [Mycobacterium sp. E2327]OBI20087.1 hypothetical protein A5712_18520 [Mycobacterium sp. E2327]
MGKLTILTSKVLIGVAVCVGAGVVGSATASADPSAFSSLSCSCQRTAPAGSPARQDAIARGIRQGLSDWPAVAG